MLNPLETWAIDLHYRKQDEGLEIIHEAMRKLLGDTSRIVVKAINAAKATVLPATTGPGAATAAAETGASGRHHSRGQVCSDISNWRIGI